MGHQHTQISLSFYSESSKVVLSHSTTTQRVLPCLTQGCRCTMRRFPARQQPAGGRRGGRAPGRTDLPSCSRTEATAGPASWTSPTASPWPSRGASHCQVSQHRSRLLMLHLCMLHFGKRILICLMAGCTDIAKCMQALWARRWLKLYGRQPPHLSHRMSRVYAMQYFRLIGWATAERHGKSASVQQRARRWWGACCGSMACRSASLRPFA